jgi:hypothetical protein
LWWSLSLPQHYPCHHILLLLLFIIGYYVDDEEKCAYFVFTIYLQANA